MSLWVDKHRPDRLSRLSLHPTVTRKLQALAKSDEIPHLLFFGPTGLCTDSYFMHAHAITSGNAGAGKKTRVMALLREIFGAGAEKVKLEHRSLKTPSNKTIDITTLGSNYHIECNPSDAGNNDRFVVQEVIKEIASHGVLQTGSAQASKGFKVVVLTEADRLSKQAQASLRRTMEKYVHMCCCSIHRCDDTTLPALLFADIRPSVASF